MCLYPKLIMNRKYMANKKNKGIVPTPKDKRALYVPVGCGKCIECKKQKARQWQVRLHEEIRQAKNGKFVTLTFDEISLAKLKSEINGLSGYELDNEIATLAVRRFLERWRKKYKKSLRHWLVTELGQTNTERVHLHGIVWTDESNEEIEIKWKYGKIWVGSYVNEKTINYIVKYINKTDAKHKEYNSKILTSPGVGNNYINRLDKRNNEYKGRETKEYYKTRAGIKLALPIYYRNKIYTEEEREKLWMQKLDEQIRYVCGQPIDISKGDEEYYKILYKAREKNKELGYGDDSINWEKKRYENKRRDMLKKGNAGGNPAKKVKNGAKRNK